MRTAGALFWSLSSLTAASSCMLSMQAGIPEAQTQVLPLGYSREILDTEAPHRARNGFRFLTITNSHDLERYGTLLLK